MVITLSEATEIDLDEIQKFIDDQHSPFVITHSLIEQQEAIRRGLFFKIRDPFQRLVAVASVVKVADTQYFEMANSLVARDWRGNGLQYELILVRAATLRAQMDDAAQLVCAINPENKPSLHTVVEKAGFRPCEQHLPDLNWACGNCPNLVALQGRSCCCDCFVLLREQHRVLVKKFLDRGGEVELAKTLSLKLDCKVAKSYEDRAILEEFVNDVS